METILNIGKVPKVDVLKSDNEAMVECVPST